MRWDKGPEQYLPQFKAKEVVEEYHIQKASSACLSGPSLDLLEEAISFPYDRPYFSDVVVLVLLVHVVLVLLHATARTPHLFHS